MSSKFAEALVQQAAKEFEDDVDSDEEQGIKGMPVEEAYEKLVKYYPDPLFHGFAMLSFLRRVALVQFDKKNYYAPDKAHLRNCLWNELSEGTIQDDLPSECYTGVDLSPAELVAFQQDSTITLRVQRGEPEGVDFSQTIAKLRIASMTGEAIDSNSSSNEGSGNPAESTAPVTPTTPTVTTATSGSADSAVIQTEGGKVRKFFNPF